VRQLGGVVSPSVGRDQVESSPVFQVSRDSDGCSQSSFIHIENDTRTAARVLADRMELNCMTPLKQEMKMQMHRDFGTLGIKAGPPGLSRNAGHLRARYR
jgi:hypothetical protein